MKKTPQNYLFKKWVMGLLGCGLLVTASQAPAQQPIIIDIVNPSFEDPAMPDVMNTTFDGVHGLPGGVPGWYSNEPSIGGAIRYDIRYPGRTGNNVLYLHGSGSQNFYTRDFDLGVPLQSHAQYTFSVDVLSWWSNAVSPITLDYTTFRIGVYTGPDYENRVPLVEWAGDFDLRDEHGNLLPSVTLVLTFTTGEVEPGTKFWIGGDRYGWEGMPGIPGDRDLHIPQFDNFQLSYTAVPEPSVVSLVILSACGVIGLRYRARKRRTDIL